MNTPNVLNIQRFSVHDGPGIRTTVFFKGCPLRCPWCHNPESQQFEPETLISAQGVPELVGKRYSVDEIIAEVEKDLLFYDQSGGGVTLSGGEAMAQDQEFIVELVRKLKAKGFNIGIDTCGVAATESFVRIAKYVDFFLYDLKFINSKQHKEWTGAGNRLVLKNLEVLAGLKAAIYLRMILLEIGR
ncbi:MAG: radical SAM protein, partial [Propionibacteriaceae bacterium]|nr:radical SAM protein [Propionibacteriaceae bacterium]